MKAILLVGGLIISASTAFAAPSIRKPESRSEPPGKVIQTLAAQFGDILIPPPSVERKKPPERPLSRLLYMTVPRATDVVGICESTSVLFRMEPVGSESVDSEQWDANTQVKVSDISTRPLYALVIPPVEAQTVYVEEEDEASAETACRKLDPYTANFDIDADSASQVARGYLIMKRLLATLHTSPAFPVNCPSYSKPGTDCRDAIVKLDPVAFSAVSDCGRSPTDDRLSCRRLSYMSIDLQVYVDGNDAPQTVAMSEYVVLGHSIKD